MDWLGVSKKDTNSSKDLVQTTVVSSNTTAGNNINTTSGNDTNIVASKFNAGGNVNITAGGAATIASASNTDYSETKDSTKSMMWQTQEGSGHVNSTVVNTEITSGGTTNISAAGGVTADVKNLTGDVQKDIATLSQQPGMAYLTTLQTQAQTNPAAAIKFNQVSDAARAWDYKTQGLTQEGAAIIAIAVTVATMGAGAALGGAAAGTAGATTAGASTAAAGTTAATMAASASAVAGTSVTLTTAGTALAYGTSAAFSTLASQAAVILVNNKGDIGKTLQQLGSEETMKNLAVAAISGGATAGIITGLGVTNSVATSAINASTSATVQTVVNGADFKDALTSQLKFAAANVVSAGASQKVGDIFDSSGALNTIGKAAAHMAVGCAAGTIANGSCGAGAAGAVSAEFAAEYAYKNLGYSIEEAKKIGQAAAVMAGAVSGYGAEGVTAANMTGTTAVENNFALHVPIMVAVRACAANVACTALAAKIAYDTGKALEAAYMEIAGHASANGIDLSKEGFDIAGATPPLPGFEPNKDKGFVDQGVAINDSKPNVEGFDPAAPVRNDEGFSILPDWAKNFGSALFNDSKPPLRQDYEKDVKALADKAGQMLDSGTDKETVARAISQERRDIGIKYKDLTPSELRETYYQQNIKDYGDPLGPTVDWLRSQGKSWDDIIDSASRPGGRGLPGTT